MHENNSLIDRIYRRLSNVPMWVMWGIVVVWTIPSLSLFINSFRSRTRQRDSGFWEFVRDGDRDYRLGCPEDYNAPDLFHMIENYCVVLSNDQASGMLSSVISSLAIAVPSTIIPISIASFAAYAFAWIDFKGRKPLFIGTVALLSIPLQVALIPLLIMYSGGAHFTIPFTERTLTMVPDFAARMPGSTA